MSWGSGARLLSEIIGPCHSEGFDLGCDEERKEFYKVLIGAFADADCDTAYECMGDDPSFDTAMRELYPDLHHE